MLRSDAYGLADDAQVRLVPPRTAAPLVDLDKPYKLVNDSTRGSRTAHRRSSAASAEVRGDWTFGRDVVVRGTAGVTAEGSPGTIPDGTVLGGLTPPIPRWRGR